MQIRFASERPDGTFALGLPVARVDGGDPRLPAGSAALAQAAARQQRFEAEPAALYGAGAAIGAGDEAARVLTHAIAHALGIPVAATLGIDVTPLMRVTLSRHGHGHGHGHGRWRLQELRRA